MDDLREYAERVDVIVVARSPVVRQRMAQALDGAHLRCREAEDAFAALGILTAGYAVRGILCVGQSARQDGIVMHARMQRISEQHPPVLCVASRGFVGGDTLEPAVPERLMRPIKRALNVDARSLGIEDPAERKELTAAQLEMNKAQASLSHVLDRVERDDLPGPMVPGLLSKLRAKLGEPNLDCESLAEFVRMHQTLTARVIAAANTAYYSRGHRVTRVEDALSRLGLQRAGGMLQAVAALEYEVGGDVMVRGLIRRSLKLAYATALAGARLATLAGHPTPADLYTAGLFHNIGETFFLYTFALLLDNGAVQPLRARALGAISLRSRESLRSVLAKRLQLSADPGADDVHLLAQASWVAERLIDDGSNLLQAGDESTLMGLTSSVIDTFNFELWALEESLAAYGA